MRLTSLTVTRYGNFESERLTFDPRPGTLNLLLAPNGAGKTVLLTAFCDLLFGIGGQSPMGFRYPYSGMRISAEAIGPGAQPFAFGRRKGQGNTLLDAAGASLDPATIGRFLGRIDREGLERLFALDTERLRIGGADLLASDGELGAALVSGAGGARDLRRLKRNLEEARDALAPLRRSSQRPFYAAIDKFVDARKRKEANLLKPDRWLKMQADLEAARDYQKEQNVVVESETAEIARLERIRRVLPWLASLDAAAAWLDAHPDAPTLDPALTPRMNEARAQIVIAEQRAKREREAAATLTHQLEQLTVDDSLLAEAADIDRLAETTGAARKATSDLPGVEAEADARSAIVTARLLELGSSLTLDRASEAVPPRAALNRARRLIQSFAALRQTVQTAPGIVSERERERDGVIAEQAALVVPKDALDLETVVKEIRGDGNPTRRSHDAAQRRTEAAANLTALLARVPGWTRGIAELVALAPLLTDSYERYGSAVAESRSAATARVDALEVARKARDAARGHFATFTAASPLPDEAGLSRARERRDRGWRLIYRRAFTVDPPKPSEEDEFTGPVPLPLAYERAVATADDIADRRVQEAALIERAQAARGSLTDAEVRFQEAETRHEVALKAQTAAEQVWTQVTGALPLGESPTVREVQAFLAARERVIDAHQALDVAAAAETSLATVHAAWAGRLAAMLAAETQVSLAELLALAEKRLEEKQKAAQLSAALQARREAAEKALVDAQAKKRQADAALEAWRQEWSETLQILHRPADEDPGVTDDVLQVFVELDQAQKELHALLDRVAGMRRDVARFTETAGELAARLTPDLDRADPFHVAATLRLRLQQARELANQRNVLKEHLQNALTSAELAERQLADRQAALQAILLLVGADTAEAAEHRLALASDRALHAANLLNAETKLAEASDLKSLSELRHEAATIPAEEIPGRIDSASRRRTDAHAAAQEAAALASALTQQTKQVEEATGATDAVADQQAAVATISRVMEEALVNHLAAEMLDLALAAVERDSEPRLLRRIGTLFSTLTGGTYERVLAETGDDSRARLILIQSDFPDERQSVKELSEGTRDQLYLALRLATIEEHAANASPLPFVGDDILQTFDDDRALAAMRVLQDFSENVQVVLLTHHRHILDLAARLPAGSVHVSRIGMRTELV
jgi:uncharacterized protein YhaN